MSPPVCRGAEGNRGREGCGGAAAVLSTGTPHPSPLQAVAHCAGGGSRRGRPSGSWWAGERREQPVSFLEASLEMSALPTVFPSWGSSAPSAAPGPRAALGSRAQCPLRPLHGMPGAPGTPNPSVPCPRLGRFWLSQGSGGAGGGVGLGSCSVRGGCRDLRRRITIARSIAELGAASPPLRRFSPLNAEQMARALQSEMSLSCLKSN